MECLPVNSGIQGCTDANLLRIFAYFDLLTKHLANGVEAGELFIGEDTDQMTFTLTIGSSCWKGRFRRSRLTY